MGSLMTMMNSVIDLLADVPPMLAAAWAAWVVAAAGLTVWYRKARLELEYVPPPPRPVSRSRSAVRPPSSVRRPAAPPVVPSEEPFAEETAATYEPPPALAPVAPRPKNPVVVGDPFGDLATLLDQPPPSHGSPASGQQASGESPILSSSGFPLGRDERH